MSCIVAKFGGSSLASSEQFKKVKDIILQDTGRRFIVVSAPGKRSADDNKITDLLLSCFYLHAEGKNFTKTFLEISERFISIRDELQLKLDIEGELEQIRISIENGASSMYVASRGEYLCGLLLSEYLSYEFIDPSSLIFFSDEGIFDAERSNRVLAEKLSAMHNAVMPGFYGAMENGEICTFSRGGSDISGAVMARALCANVYENWTDVSGFLMANPNIVSDPLEIKSLSYEELRELKYMEAGVLHEDAIYPVQKAGLATNIRNTNMPCHPGTLIVNDDGEIPLKKSVITGIAGKAGFDILRIDKPMSSAGPGIAMRLLQAFCENDIRIEQIVSSVAQISVVLSSDVLADPELKEALYVRINELVQPRTINLEQNVALLAVVGRAMRYSPNCNSRIFSALYKENIDVRAILQNNSRISTILAIASSDLNKAINAVYREFVH